MTIIYVTHGSDVVKGGSAILWADAIVFFFVFYFPIFLSFSLNISFIL